MNSQVGLPRMMCRLSDKHEMAVIEMGMSMPGEMARIVRVARPECAVITNIGVSHIEQLGTYENILREKLNIRPTWLFMFPSVFRVQNPVDSAIATISFVVVLPTLPVTPTTGIPKFPRTCAPKRCNASTFGFFSPGISIYTTAISSAFNDSATSLRHVKVALIPCAPASLIKSCASTCSPITGTNMVAASPTLESVENSVILIPPSPAISSPPTISAISPINYVEYGLSPIGHVGAAQGYKFF